MDYYARIIENRLQIERIERRGSLLAALGPWRTPATPALFRRTVVLLPAEVVVHHPGHSGSGREAPTRKPEAA